MPTLGNNRKQPVDLLKEMVAYDEPCVVPIKRTLQKIDYQNQTYKELEVRPKGD